MIRTLFLFSFLSVCGSLISQRTITYEEDTSAFFNPERGFTEWTETFTSGYTPLTLVELQDMRDLKMHSLVFRYFYLDNHLSDTIPNSDLQKIRTDFNLIRQAGLKSIIRFAYTDNLNSSPPYNDSPPKSLLIKHIQQLMPIIIDNKDLIVTIQNGFWGVWGENFYSDYFGCEEDAALTVAQKNDRKEVFDTLTKYLPQEIILSLRYPSQKIDYLSISYQDTTTYNQAYTNTLQARIGFHNDCFLVSEDDYTYSDTTLEKPYVQNEANYTIMGGETCGDNASYTNCANALKELGRFHWSYLNDYYHPSVISRWLTEGCYAEISKKLGYRIRLISSTFDSIVHEGDSIEFTIDMVNDGYSAPISPKRLSLSFEGLSNNYEFDIDNVDLRLIGRDSFSVHGVIPTQNMSLDDYQVYMNISDTNSSMSNSPWYKVRVANKNTWDSFLGRNKLNQSVRIEQVLSIEEVKTLSNYLTIQNGDIFIHDASIERLKVYTSDGKLCINQSVDSNDRVRLNQEFSNQVFIIHLFNRQGFVVSGKIKLN